MGRNDEVNYKLRHLYATGKKTFEVGKNTTKCCLTEN